MLVLRPYSDEPVQDTCRVLPIWIGLTEATQMGLAIENIRLPRPVTPVSYTQLKNGKSSIVISEIPYQVNRTNLLKKIADLVRDKKLPEVSAVHDAAYACRVYLIRPAEWHFV